MFGVVLAFALGIILTKAGVPPKIMWRIMFGFDIITIIYGIVNCLIGYIP
jgi:hypothetical protein